jgi:hypothetical protein
MVSLSRAKSLPLLPKSSDFAIVKCVETTIQSHDTIPDPKRSRLEKIRAGLGLKIRTDFVSGSSVSIDKDSFFPYRRPNKSSITVAKFVEELGHNADPVYPLSKENGTHQPAKKMWRLKHFKEYCIGKLNKPHRALVAKNWSQRLDGQAKENVNS